MAGWTAGLGRRPAGSLPEGFTNDLIDDLRVELLADWKGLAITLQKDC